MLINFGKFFSKFLKISPTLPLFHLHDYFSCQSIQGNHIQAMEFTHIIEFSDLEKFNLHNGTAFITRRENRQLLSVILPQSAAC